MVRALLVIVTMLLFAQHNQQLEAKLALVDLKLEQAEAINVLLHESLEGHQKALSLTEYNLKTCESLSWK